MVFADKIHEVTNVLENDGVILYPTDTIWGLGAALSSLLANEKIYTIKNRERSQPLILLVSSIEMLKRYVDIHPRIETLLHFHEQPLTVIYTKTQFIDKSLLASDGSIAIRIIKDPFVNTVIDLLGEPITSTSANISGEAFPKHFGEVNKHIQSNVNYVCKHRREDHNFLPPSVMISFNKKGDIKFLRK